MKQIQDRIEKSRTHQVKMVFPESTNHYKTLFGGVALQWMDEVAFLTATRFSRQSYVTVSSDKIDFKVAIPEGTMVELIGKVSMVGKTSLKVLVTVWVEEMFSDNRIKAIEGEFSMVCVNSEKKPVEIAI